MYIEEIVKIYKEYSSSNISKKDKEILMSMLESVNDNEIQFNLSKWRRNSSTNILFITGLSGSGKSTLASELSKENDAINIEVDLLEHNSILFEDKHPDRANQIMKEYMQKTYGGPKKFQTSNTVDFNKEVIKFINYMIQYSKQHKEELFILEGIQIADASTWKLTKNNDPKIQETINMSIKLMDTISNYPVIIKNTSIIESISRAAKREGNIKDYIKSFKSIKEVKDFILWYAEMNKNKNTFLKNMKERR